MILLGRAGFSTLAVLFVALNFFAARAQTPLPNDIWPDGTRWGGNVSARDLSMEWRVVWLTISGGKITVRYNRPDCESVLVLDKSEPKNRLAKFKEQITSGSGCESGATVHLIRKSESVINFTYNSPKSKRLFWGALTRDYRVAREALEGGDYPAPRSAEVTIEEIGIRVVDVDLPHTMTKPSFSEVPREKRTGAFRNIPRVVAVREGSTAFYAGVTPGDVVISWGYDDWFMRSSASLANAVKQYAHVRGRTKSMLGVYYHMTDSPHVEQKIFTLSLQGGDTRGRWITEVPTHTSKHRAALAGVESANEKARTEYQELWRRSFATVVSTPCGVSKRQIADMSAQLKAAANRAGANSDMWVIGEGKWQDVERDLNETAEAVCENSRDGGLTKLESVLLAIALRQLDPCAYTSSADYSAIFNDYQNVRYYSKRGYNSYFSRRLERRSMPVAQQECFDRLVRSAFDELHR